MTQAFNLSQLANRVNTSGQLDASTGLSGTAPIANGGTNNGTLAVTAGGVLYTDGSKVVNVGAGTSGQILQSNGVAAPSWAIASSYAGPNCAVFATGGSFVVPTGILQIIVVVIGGGGGGKSGSGGGGCGGGGGLAIAECTNVSGTLTVTVGSAGAINGGSGTASSVTGTNVSVTATGGAGGVGMSHGAGGTGTVTTGTALITKTGYSGSQTAIPEWDNPAYFLNGINNVPFGLNASITWTITSAYRPGGRGLGVNLIGANSGGGVSGAVIIFY